MFLFCVVFTYKRRKKHSPNNIFTHSHSLTCIHDTITIFIGIIIFQSFLLEWVFVFFVIPDIPLLGGLGDEKHSIKYGPPYESEVKVLCE